jgi:outer membrane protein assembly factor BamD
MIQNLRHISALFLLGLLVHSCADYNKVIKGDDYKRKFELADELFTSNQYDRCIVLYEQIYQRMPKTGEGELAYFRIGKSYYESGDFYMAGYYLGAFTQRFPYSVKAQEALFLSAMCSVNNSPEASLDQNDTELAINNLQQFIDTYPQSSLVDSCNKIMDRLHLKLEKKDFDAVRLYSKTENYRAAVTSASSFMQDYPRSKNRQEVMFILVKNAYYLALNSVDEKKKERIEEAMERYRTFVAEFPESTHDAEVDGYYDALVKELEKLNTRK